MAEEAEVRRRANWAVVRLWDAQVEEMEDSEVAECKVGWEAMLIQKCHEVGLALTL